MPKIVLIEDDVDLGELIARVLRNKNYRVSFYDSVEAFMGAPLNERADLVICDVMLPDGNGFDLAASIKTRFHCPFLFLTALDSDQAHIRGLELGACDYLIKPIKPEILLARVAANLRKSAAPLPTSTSLCELRLDTLRKEAWYGKKNLGINSDECRILQHLINADPNPMARGDLFKAVLGRDYDGTDRAIDLKISRLRKKLSKARVPVDIKASRGQGYRITVDEL